VDRAGAQEEPDGAPEDQAGQAVDARPGGDPGAGARRASKYFAVAISAWAVLNVTLDGCAVDQEAGAPGSDQPHGRTHTQAQAGGALLAGICFLSAVSLTFYDDATQLEDTLKSVVKKHKEVRPTDGEGSRRPTLL
jgi:hypothetical protein